MMPQCLLVDDRDDNLLALEALLSGEGLRLFKARSGAEALELLLIHDFAVALLDVHMPGMSGFELAELMRGSSRSRHIPIIFVTAAGAPRERVFKGYESGAVDFLTKPIDAHVMRSKVRVLAELYQQRQRLQQQVEAVRTSELAAKEALAARDRFISIAGHELRTPLSVLNLQLALTSRQMAQADTVPRATVVQLLDNLQRQVTRLSGLVDQMLDVTCLESDNLRIHPGPCNLTELITEIVERLQPLLREARCDFRMNCEPGVHGCWDGPRLEQVIANLLTNAARYCEGARVELTLRSTGSMAELRVRDGGPGISPERLSQIFLPFERGADHANGGLGLGLYIVKSITEMHGGSVSVTSAVGKGTTFTLQLPLTGAVGPGDAAGN